MPVVHDKVGKWGTIFYKITIDANVFIPKLKLMKSERMDF